MIKLNSSLFPQSLRINPGTFGLPTRFFLENGPFAQTTSPGVICMLPLGMRLRQAIEYHQAHVAEEFGFSLISVPHLQETSLLDIGQPLSAGFKDTVVGLAGRLENKHLLCTPEPFFIDIFKSFQISHRSLPVRLVYQTDFHRQLRKPVNFLKGREFRMLGGVALESDHTNMVSAIDAFRHMTMALFSALNIELIESRSSNPEYVEFFFKHSLGDAVVKSEGRSYEAFSMAMAYHYADKLSLPIRYRSSVNKNASPYLVTYGLGTQRQIFALMETHRDELGFNFPSFVRPFDIAVLPASTQFHEDATKIAAQIEDKNLQVVYDNRFNVKMDERVAFARFVGAPLVLVVAGKKTKILRRKGTDVLAVMPDEAVNAVLTAYHNL